MIETERLLLRPPVLADFEASAAMFADADVTAHIGGTPLDRETAWTRFLRDAGHWSLHPFGLFTVIEKASGAYVGKVGYAHFQRDLGLSNAAIEMSWTLASGFHGRGYASEAGRAAQAWFDATHGLRTACLIAPANLPSLRLADRLGYREVDRFVPNGRDPERKIVVLARDPGGT
ncbi:GNAT family N-acetyltransferase [Novosphingobium sp. BL-8A]|uniref:GNAT family N-acetyltransferase n=1 Tax=Novosphingobium sp. BL-8A TaxID=3127639 RepID=UPI0037570DC8